MLIQRQQPYGKAEIEGQTRSIENWDIGMSEGQGENVLINANWLSMLNVVK